MNPQSLTAQYGAPPPGLTPATSSGSGTFASLWGAQSAPQNDTSSAGQGTKAVGAVENGAKSLFSSFGNTFQQGAKDVTGDIANTKTNADNAGGGVGADILSGVSSAGHVAGDVAKTAGGLIGDVISPLLPDSVKSGLGDASKYINDKVNAIPGMTPEIAKSLGDVFNTSTLLGGAKAEPVVGDLATAGAEKAGQAIAKGTEAVSNAGEAVKGAVTKSPVEVAQTSFEKSLSDAQQSIYPKLSPTEKANVTLKDESGVFGKKSVPDLVNDPKTKSVIEAVANLPEDIKIKPSDTLAEKESKLNQGINRLHQGTNEFMSDPKIKANTTFNNATYDKFMKGKVLDPIEKEFGKSSVEYKEAQKAIQSSKGSMEQFDVQGVHNGRQTFDTQFKSDNPRAFAKAKGSMSSMLDPKTNAVIDAGRAVRNGMNDFRDELLNQASLREMPRFNPTQTRDLINRAENFPTKKDFIEQMKTEGSASNAEEKFAQKTGTPNKGTAKSTVSESGLNVNERSNLKGGTHGKGYSTTPEEDLGEIWDMAHTEAIPSNPIKARVREESNLIRAKEEMRARSTGELDKNAVERSLDRNPAVKKGVNYVKGALKVGTGVDIVNHL